MTTDADRRRIEAWTDRARLATIEAEGSATLLAEARGPDAAIDSGALVSIALSLSVIAEALVLAVDPA